jgi:hypothetical protein
MKSWAITIVGLVWLHGAPAAAKNCLDGAVPGHPAVSTFSVIKRLIPDLAIDGDGNPTGHTIVPYNYIDGTRAESELPDDIGTCAFQIVPMPGDTSRLIVFLDLGHPEGSVTDLDLLALFSLTPAAKLLDVVAVGNDRDTSMTRGKPMMLAPDAPLIVLDDGHANPNQTYHTTELIFVRGDRFRLIDTILTFGERYCPFERTQAPTITTLPDTGPYRAVQVTVRETVTLTGEACDDEKVPRAGVFLYRATYRWNARRARFVATSHQIDDLRKANERRF